MNMHLPSPAEELLARLERASDEMDAITERLVEHLKAVRAEQKALEDIEAADLRRRQANACLTVEAAALIREIQTGRPWWQAA